MQSQGFSGTPGGGREEDVYSLKWHTFHSHLSSTLRQFLLDPADDFLSDVTLVAEGQCIRSHRLLLSLCSPHFKKLLQQGRVSTPHSGAHYITPTNTVIILNNVAFRDLRHIIEFIYNGEVKIKGSLELQGFLQTGELLQIEGLAKSSGIGGQSGDNSSSSAGQTTTTTPNDGYHHHMGQGINHIPSVVVPDPTTMASKVQKTHASFLSPYQSTSKCQQRNTAVASATSLVPMSQPLSSDASWEIVPHVSQSSSSLLGLPSIDSEQSTSSLGSKSCQRPPFKRSKTETVTRPQSDPLQISSEMSLNASAHSSTTGNLGMQVQPGMDTEEEEQIIPLNIKTEFDSVDEDMYGSDEDEEFAGDYEVVAFGDREGEGGDVEGEGGRGEDNNSRKSKAGTSRKSARASTVADGAKNQGQKLEVSQTERGARISHRGFYYSFQKKGTQKKIWRCVRCSKFRCRARLHTTESDLHPEIIKIIGEHNHEPGV